MVRKLLNHQKELAEEAGIEYPYSPFGNRAIDILPFMKSGTIPQLLFSFGFLNDLSRFPVGHTLEDIAEFEAQVRGRLNDRTLQQREAYHFTVPLASAEKVTWELRGSERLYGPVYESTMNFFKALKDEKLL